MMKKIIALALALSMALSMVAFAGYTDAAEINKDLTADVELAGALGLMTGNPDGSFNPAGTLTRAEAAVIVYRLHSGKSTIDASWGDAALSTFTDMDHWSVAYVNYGAALGLITGYTDGTYRPENEVTVAEMAKLLLTVLGYSTEKQGYGKNWPMSVLADATVAGLLNEYEQAFTGKATREWVAKMLVNMLDANNVAYSQLTGTLTSSGLGQFGDKYDVTSVKVTAKANAVLALDGSEAAGKGKATLGTATVKYDLPAELVGRTVKVYFKGASLTNDSKIYTVVDASKSVTTTLDKIEIKEATVDNVKAKYLHVDGAATKGLKTDLTTLYVNLNNQASALAAWDGKKISDTREVTLVDNDANGKYDTIFMNEVMYDTVSAIDAEKKTAELGSGLKVNEKGTGTGVFCKWEAVNFVDTIAKNDVVRIETTFNAKGEAVYNVSKVNALRTKIASVSPSTDTFTVGATAYTGADTKVNGFNMSTFTNTTLLATNALKKSYDIYTDGKYVVLAQATPTGSTEVSGLNMDVALLIASQSGTAGNAFSSAVADKVQVMFADGNAAVYEYKAPSSGTKVAFNAVTPDKVYEYILNDDGSIYFKDVAAGTGATVNTSYDESTVDYTANETTAKSFLAIGDTKLFANENTFFFVKRVYDNPAKSFYSVMKASEVAEDAVFDSYAFQMAADKKIIAYTSDTKTGLSTLAYAVLSLTDSSADELPALPAPVVTAVSGDYFFVTKAAAPVYTATSTTWEVTGMNANGEIETISLTKNDNNVRAGQLYVIKTTDKDVYLDDYLTASNLVDATGVDLTASANANKWYTVKITATNGSVIIANDTSGAMISVADDATIVMVSMTGDTDSTTDGSQAGWTVAASELKYSTAGAAVNCFVKLDKNGVVTDIFMGQYRATSSADWARMNITDVIYY